MYNSGITENKHKLLQKIEQKSLKPVTKNNMLINVQHKYSFNATLQCFVAIG